MTPEERKSESLAVLTELGVPVLMDLPCIEGEESVTLRRAEDVAARALCLMVVSDVAHGADRKVARQYLEEHRLWAGTTAAERDLLSTRPLTRTEIVETSWLCESAFFLFWALGSVDLLPLPEMPVELDALYDIMPEAEAVEVWVGSSSLVTKTKILDEADLLYRMHWACRQAHLSGADSDVFDILNYGVVANWHRAANWLIRHQEQEWDDVTTDT